MSDEFGDKCARTLSIATISLALLIYLNVEFVTISLLKFDRLPKPERMILESMIVTSLSSGQSFIIVSIVR